MVYRKSRIIYFSFFLLLALLAQILFIGSIRATDLTIMLTIPGSSTPVSGGSGGAPQPVGNVRISGFAYPGAIVTFLRDGAVIGTEVAEASGRFERLFLVDPGSATFGLWARDRYGLISPTVNISFTLTEGSVAEIDLVSLPPTIGHEHITEGGALTMYGSAFPASVVRVFNNINTFTAPLTTVAGANGRWEYKLAREEFNPGNFSYKANYQYEPQSILSPFSSDLALHLVTCSNSDFNNDGAINLTDLSILLYYWGRPLPKSGLANGCVDRNGDQTVNLVDFSILMYEWTVKYQQS